jgi:hypothetical protein
VEIGSRPLVCGRAQPARNDASVEALGEWAL